MADAGVIREFLVSLGWQVDQRGQKQFEDALKGAQRVALGVTAALAGVTAAVVKTADAYSRMGYEAQNAMSSVSGMQSLAYAIRQVGGSAQGVSSSLQGIGNFLRFSGPGAESVFRRIGIATRDAHGNIRDTSDILEDFFKRARQMPQYRAAAYADLIGVDRNTLLAGERNPGMLHAARDQWRDIYNRLGIDPDRAAAQSQDLMRQINRLMASIQAIGLKLTLSLGQAFGGKNLDDFTNYLLSHSDDIAKSIQQFVAWAKQAVDWVRSVASTIVDLV